jgi:acyl phosphate:glycerol-3-phosphate acyltransferase
MGAGLKVRVGDGRIIFARHSEVPVDPADCQNAMEFTTGHARDLIVICAAYAIGCFSPGYWLVRLRTGRDIREIESGSTGSSNVARVLGKPGFALTMLADCAKGSLALGAARYYSLSPSWTVATLLAVLAGHIWPLPLGLRGGKGLATTLGALIVFDPTLTCGLCGLGITGLLLGFGSPSLLAGVSAAPAVAALLRRSNVEIAGLSILVLLIWIAHRDNIRAFFAAKRGRKGQRV